MYSLIFFDLLSFGLSMLIYARIPEAQLSAVTLLMAGNVIAGGLRLFKRRRRDHVILCLFAAAGIPFAGILKGDPIKALWMAAGTGMCALFYDFFYDSGIRRSALRWGVIFASVVVIVFFSPHPGAGLLNLSLIGSALLMARMSADRTDPKTQRPSFEISNDPRELARLKGLLLRRMTVKDEHQESNS